ncbi:hypothetical protein [Aestuariibaculum sediminum]|uniref:Uncharacterized protein n=1 Tax=Aestuariibaculum sediminum TaxID=2770637 RepID=A0A8J6U8L0_9FLAO|nr:hypothetical protein [Aestuariibaculum sediminum]MBD0831722.1 hypothetical protein [Aestuariibaculum sediminum]
MDDFLKDYNFIFSTGIEILAAVTGLILYKRYKQTAAKYFIWFLVYLTICDFANNYVHHIKNDGLFSFLRGTVFIANFWWSTLYWKIGAIVFLAFYYHKILSSKGFKAVVKYSAFVFVIFSFVYILLNFEAFFKRFFPVISVLGAIIIFMCTIFYFIEVLLSDKILTFYKSLNFYISFAIFIWWLIITPLVFYDIYNSHLDWNFILLKWQIYLMANVAMYLTFTFALIWCRPQKN